MTVTPWCHSLYGHPSSASCPARLSPNTQQGAAASETGLRQMADELQQSLGTFRKNGASLSQECCSGRGEWLNLTQIWDSALSSLEFHKHLCCDLHQQVFPLVLEVSCVGSSSSACGDTAYSVSYDTSVARVSSQLCVISLIFGKTAFRFSFLLSILGVE